MTAHVASLRIHTLVYVQKDSKGKTVKVSIIKLHITTFNFLSQAPLSSTYAGLNNEEKRHSFDTAVFQANSYLRRWTAIEAIAEKVQAPMRFEPVPLRSASWMYMRRSWTHGRIKFTVTVSILQTERWPGVVSFQGSTVNGLPRFDNDRDILLCSVFAKAFHYLRASFCICEY